MSIKFDYKLPSKSFRTLQTTVNIKTLKMIDHRNDNMAKSGKETPKFPACVVYDDL